MRLYVLCKYSDSWSSLITRHAALCSHCIKRISKQLLLHLSSKPFNTSFSIWTVTFVSFLISVKIAYLSSFSLSLYLKCCCMMISIQNMFSMSNLFYNNFLLVIKYHEKCLLFSPFYFSVRQHHLSLRFILLLSSSYSLN